MKQGFMPSTNLTTGGKDGIIRVYITVCWLSEREITMKRQLDKKIYLYGRLSHEYELQGDSNSIINQRKILTKYAEDNGFTPYEFIYDDGFSGADFERPAFSQMIEEVEAGNVATVIVKDMSRFGCAGIFGADHQFQNVVEILQGQPPPG